MRPQSRPSGPRIHAGPGKTGAVERALPNGHQDTRPRAWRTLRLRRASRRSNHPGARPRQRQWTRHHDGFPHLRHTPIEGRVTLSEAGLLAHGSSSGTAFPTAILGSPISGFLAPTRRSQLRGQPRLASGIAARRFRRSLLISRLAPGRTADNALGNKGRRRACQPPGRMRQGDPPPTGDGAWVAPVHRSPSDAIPVVRRRGCRGVPRRNGRAGATPALAALLSGGPCCTGPVRTGRNGLSASSFPSLACQPGRFAG